MRYRIFKTLHLEYMNEIYLLAWSSSLGLQGKGLCQFLSCPRAFAHAAAFAFPLII
jgi:hypothetical protein